MLNTTPIYILSGAFGLMLGSFANVCIWRMPQNQSVVAPRSRCARCGHTLRAIDNVPVLSFLLLGRKCHFCHDPISWQYPAVELCMMALFLFNVWTAHASWLPVLFLDVLAFYLFTLSVIDFHHRIIPDELSLSLLIIGWATSFFNPFLDGTAPHRVLESIVSSLVGGFLMLGLAWLGEKLFKKEALGGGDIKLVAALGAVLGWNGLWGTLVMGSFSGGLLGVVLILIRQKKRGDTLPFGPFLSLGAFVTASFSHSIINLIFP